MIEALIAGEVDPTKLAALALRGIKAPKDDLSEALRGRVTKNHRFLLRLHLRQIDTLEATIADIDREVDAHVEPFRGLIDLLISIPGISELSARVILAEIGCDISRFPRDISSPGPAFVLETTRARESGGPTGCAREPLG